MSRVFVIGYSKTCTTSLAEALSILGYKTTGFNIRYLRKAAEGDMGWFKSISDEYGAFHDWPYPLIYKDVYDLYPDSKFILTLRKSPEVWYNSMRLHSLLIMNRQIHQLSMGLRDLKNKKKSIGRYNDHLKEVSNFFEDKPQSFLPLIIDAGDGWEKLCAFLNKPIPKLESDQSKNQPFPKLNVKAQPLSRVFENKIKTYENWIRVGGKMYNDNKDKKNVEHLKGRISLYEMKHRQLKKILDIYKAEKRKIEKNERKKRV